MKNLLLTGANGFVGKNISPILEKSYNLTSLGFSQNNDICVNLSQTTPCINKKIDVVLHLAGKAHIVPRTTKEKQSFYAVNVQGTENLCHAFEQEGNFPETFVFLSTLDVYGDVVGTDFTEKQELNPLTPYADSKKQAEDFLIQWCKNNNVRLVILRASLILGKNPVGNLAAMINGIKSGRYLSISNGKARKSMLMVEDIANLIPLVEDKEGVFNICDTESPSFKDLETLIAKQLNKKPPMNIPYWFAKILAICGDILGRKAPINSKRLRKITETQTFSNKKAITELSFQPLNVLQHFKI